MKQISLYGLESMPEVKQGDDLVQEIYDACIRENVDLAPGDVVIVTSKVVSKAEGRILDLKEITPSRRARAIATLTGKDPVEVEIILRDSQSIRAVIPVKKIVAHFPHVLGDLAPDKSSVARLLNEEPSLLITVTKQGILASDAAMDYSNNPGGMCTLLPENPTESARRIREGLTRHCGGDVAVILTDTEVAYMHLYGSLDIAIGYSGILPVSRGFGTKDRFGREKFGGVDVVVDELASSAALLMGQTSQGVPVVIAKNVAYERGEEVPPAATPVGILSKGIWWSILSTLKLRFAGLLALFV
jgi:coenzyme F420-0:L-glutamate ligase/coenzyme F420-1:gamma-L-glutamate ligase